MKLDIHIFASPSTLDYVLTRNIALFFHRNEYTLPAIFGIEDVVKKNYDKTVEFVKIPQAEQYRESQKILQQYAAWSN